MRGGSAVLSVLVGVLSGGCQIDYTADITLKRDGLEQRVSVSDGRLQAEGDQIRTFDVGQKRSGTLPQPSDDGVQQMPADLGVEPSWTHLTSPLGEIHVLSLPRGGDVSVADGVDAIQSLAHELAKETALWLGVRFPDEPWLGPAVKLVRGPLADDLADLGTTAWAVIWTAQLLDIQNVMDDAPRTDAVEAYTKQVTHEVNARVMGALAAFLTQRGWISVEAASLLVDLKRGDSMLAVLETAQLSALGASLFASMRERLGIQDEAQLWAALDQISRRWERDAMDTVLQMKIAEHLKGNLHLQAALLPLTDFLTSVDLSTTVRVGARGAPVFSNATWSGAAGTLVWKLDASPWAPGLARPPIFWAADWASPDEAAQQRVLGPDHVLEGGDLVAFVVAWNSTSDAGRALLEHAWDAGQFHDRKGSTGEDLANEMIELLVQMP